MRADAASIRRALSKSTAEITLGVAALSGWASLTVGVRGLVHGHAQATVWPISLGLLLLSASGWGFLGTVALRGLYVILRKARND